MSGDQKDISVVQIPEYTHHALAQASLFVRSHADFPALMGIFMRRHFAHQRFVSGLALASSSSAATQGGIKALEGCDA